MNQITFSGSTLPLFPPSSPPAMPDGYYSGDKPNPNIKQFVRTCGTTYDPKANRKRLTVQTETIHVGNRRSPLNDLHIYWSKKPHEAVQSYINHFASPGSLVLDPFAGSGGTALCALRNGCSVIAIDASPAATFICRYYCTPVDLDEFSLAYDAVCSRTNEVTDWLYESRMPDGSAGLVAYTVWSDVYRCTRCLDYIPLAMCAEAPALKADGSHRMTRSGQPATISVCPRCLEAGTVQPVTKGRQRYGRVPTRASISSSGGLSKKRVGRLYPFPRSRSFRGEEFSLEDIADCCSSPEELFDLKRLIEIRDGRIPFSYPITRMMNVSPDTERWGILWRAGVADFRTIDEIFDKRALWAVASHFQAVREVSCSDNVRAALHGLLSSSLWNCSRMYRERETGGGPQEGVYYLPPVSREVNVHTVVSGKRVTFAKANADLRASILSTNLLISTQSACDLSAIPDNSIDYIFTDPPYSWKVPYGELNFLWESFLGLSTDWHSQEITISDIRGIDEAAWTERLRQAFQECYRVLKPGFYFTLCYHDSSEGTWSIVQDILAECGFLAEQSERAISIETGQKSLKQLTSGTITQRDLVINFRKPVPSEVASSISITGDEDSATFSDKVRAIVNDYLTMHSGSTEDRIYDEVVSRMVRAGQMEPHDFNALLAQVADPIHEPVKKNLFENRAPDLFGTHEIIRWYLKETEMALVDSAESAKEDAAAVTIGAFVKERLGTHPGEIGIHYSDVFEQYVYLVRDKPRRQLADWLLDYFFKTDAGTYRLPATEEEAHAKADGRINGTSRRVRRYLAFLDHGVAVPEKERPNDATLSEWIRHCKRAGLYSQGKILFERGGLSLGHLSEEDQVNVEEDYDVCVRALARESAEESRKSRKGK